MIKKIIGSIVGSRNQREIKKLFSYVEKINAVYETYHSLSREDILKKTEDFEKRLRDGESSEALIPESFALVKEVCRQLVGKKWSVTGDIWEWNMIPFDVQLIGGIVLFQGKIAEMKTGEGKTLVATMPLYLHGIIGRIKNKGAHIVTVNDYLARRDKEWMQPVYESLGLSVGVIQGGMSPQERKPEYDKDITYGTNNEFGFDYLRDNMVYNPLDRVQRGHYYSIVDEVDSILIDEARTPLIISGPVEHSSQENYRLMRPIADNIVRKQMMLVNKFLMETEKLLKEGKNEEAATKLLIAKRGAPKAKKVFKFLQEPGLMKLVDKAELEWMKDKKIKELDEQLYFVVDEKSRSVDFTEKGRGEVQKREKALFVLPDLSIEIAKVEKEEGLSPRERFVEKERVFREYAEKSDKLHALTQLLKAYILFEKDVDYVVMEGKVIIVDEFTGRLMPGRRWSEGLHEAVEAKEKVKIQKETQTLATITIQNYFRMYERLAGMTGTAATEAQEFWEIYKLDVLEIPTNKPIRRVDYPDIIYKTKREKYDAIIREIEKLHNKNLPVLVGTTSVEISELLSRMLIRRKVPHQVLNAKHHEKEAHIVARAGQPGAVTIATNMAGRGTDIKLGAGVIKNPEQPDFVIKQCAINTKNPEQGVTCPRNPRKCIEEGVPCGLHIVGTEKHESRRIDNQLRGRAGRQGDPGASRFILSLEDDLLRLFGSDRVVSVMERFGKKDEGPIESKMVTSALERAQKRVEMQNFAIRKRLLDYDDVMNKQREVVYGLRNDILDGKNLKDLILNTYVDELLDEKIEQHCPRNRDTDEWDKKTLREELSYFFLLDFSDIEKAGTHKEIVDIVKKEVTDGYNEREEAYGSEKMREIENIILLSTLDVAWREHLYTLDQLKEGIFLRSYAQKDPLVEYKKESFDLFDQLLDRIRNETIMRIFRVQVPKLPRKMRDRMRAYKPSVDQGSTGAGRKGN